MYIAVSDPALSTWCAEDAGHDRVALRAEAMIWHSVNFQAQRLQKLRCSGCTPCTNQFAYMLLRRPYHARSPPWLINLQVLLRHAHRLRSKKSERCKYGKYVHK